MKGIMMTKKYTPIELGKELVQATARANGDVSNNPRVMQAWREHERELQQQLWNLQHGRSDSR